MRRFTIIAVIVGLAVIVVLAVGTWFLLSPNEYVWRISDVTTSQDHKVAVSHYRWLLTADGLMAIRATGHLSEPAILSTPLGQVDLPTGDFDLIAIENEAYTPRADFRFTPSDGAKGFVTVTVCLGSGATWAYRPPPTALPIFRTGGWNTYYAGTDKMAWSGGFYHGVRSGEFTYWDEAGNITNREEWENGTKKN